MASDRKRSNIWAYFTVSVYDEKKAVCNECHESVAHGSDKTNSFTTSNLCKDLKVHHAEKFKQLEESEKAAKVASKESSQNPFSSTTITLGDCFECSRPYPVDHPVAQKISCLIGEMVVRDCHC